MHNGIQQNARRLQAKSAVAARTIKKALIDRGTTITQLASRLGYARNTLSMAIHQNPRRLRKARAAVLDHLKLS